MASFVLKPQHIVIGCVIALSSLCVFFIYYKPDIDFPLAGFCNRAPTEMVQCVQGNDTQSQSPTLVSKQHGDQHYNNNNIIQDADVGKNDIIVLIWMWPFGFQFELSCRELNIQGCHLTDDKALYANAHVVIFHHRDIHGDLSNMPKEPRPWFQKWVWFNMESPANLGRIPQLNDLFNLTSNYRLDSTIPVPYLAVVPVTRVDRTFKIPAKDKLVCWIVSNWNPAAKRVQFYTELKKHINIEPYGGAFDRHINDEEFLAILPSCKFYLSFENSIYTDYITEKLANPMVVGTVPVVLGPPRKNYEAHVPGDSFIHVEDFETPKELADRLHFLDQNHSEYMRYFDWRQNFEVKRIEFGHYAACETCVYVQRHRNYQAFKGLDKWYWG